MVLGDAPQQEIFGVIPIRRAELPERIADGVQPSHRHVDRTEPAVRGPVRRPELLRPQPRKRLHLVASSEKGELRRVGCANLGKPRGQDLERLVPLDLDKIACIAFTSRPTQERLAQFRR